MAEKTPEQIENQRAKWRERATRQRAKRKALGIKPKDRTEYVKAHREKNREAYNAYARKWKELKRREEGILPKEPWTPERKIEYFRRWTAEHRTESLQYTKKWRDRNVEKIAVYRKQYLAANKEALRKKAEEYRLKNQKKIRDNNRKAKARSLALYRATSLRNTRNRRVRKFGVPGTHTEEEWLALCEQFEHRCVKCGIHKSESKISRDHIIPITWDGSTHFIANIQPLCMSCNGSKQNRYAIDFRPNPFKGIGEFVKTSGDDNASPPLVSIAT